MPVPFSSPIGGAIVGVGSSYANGGNNADMAYSALSYGALGATLNVASYGVGLMGIAGIRSGLFGQAARNAFAGALRPNWKPALVHLTRPAYAAAIDELGVIGSRWGVFAAKEALVPRSRLLRHILTLVPGNISREVRIVGKAATHFKAPPKFGVFSIARRMAGVRSTPLGTVNLKTGEFIANQIMVRNGGTATTVFRAATKTEIGWYYLHQFGLDYGIDSLLYTGGIGASYYLLDRHFNE